MAAARVFAFLTIVSQLHRPIVLTDCTIDLNKDYKINSPLFLDKKTLDVIYPIKTSPKQLTFKPGEDRLIHCLGARLARFNRSTNSADELTKCRKNNTFYSPANAVDYSFDDVSCLGSPTPITKEDRSRKCPGNSIPIDIGYQVTSSVFKRIIDLCHVGESASTLWSHSKVPAVIGAYKSKDFSAPAFSKGSYFGNVLISQVYPKSRQQQTFLALFDNDSRLVDRYLPQDGKAKNYLVKGHLVARADLFYPAEQYGTYFYLNVLPMWQSINNGNWKSVESTVRRIAASSQSDLEVWTGGIGILRLAGKDIYLSRNKKNGSKLLVPVPKLLFKLVVRERSEALVFVTANDPYLGDEVPEDYRICREYKECEVKFANFKQKFEGFTYCCKYEDFKASSEVKKLGLPMDLKDVAPLKLY